MRLTLKSLSNEQTEQQANQRKTHRWRADDSQWGNLGGGGIEQKRKRTHRHGQQCGDCWDGGV